MKKPQISDGIKKYLEFHDMEPDNVTPFPKSLKIPKTVYKLGDMVEIRYHSTKWGDPADYIHEHEAGVCCYSPMRTNPGLVQEPVKVPTWLREQNVLVRLGDCLGFSFEDDEGLVEANIGKNRPHLFCTADGKALIIVSPEMRIETIIWGGWLGVEKRGIVG